MEIPVRNFLTVVLEQQREVLKFMESDGHLFGTDEENEEMLEEIRGKIKDLEDQLDKEETI